MHYLWNAIILPLMECIHARTVVEIGTGDGKNTINILEYARQVNGTVHSIDTKHPNAIDVLLNDYPEQLVFHQEQSLKALDAISQYDAVLIDGDHNWYTVYNELQTIYTNAGSATAFPLVVLHDIAWPYARRDLYYDPSTIPDVYLHPYQKGGISLDKDTLSETGLNADLYHSIQENIPRCGVLTAVEDFLAEHQGEFKFYNIPGNYGLGIIVSHSALERNAQLRTSLDEYNISAPVSTLIHTVENSRITAVMLRQKYENMCGRLNDRCKELNHAIEAMRKATQADTEDAKRLAEEREQYKQELETTKQRLQELEDVKRRMQQAQKANAELLQLTQDIQKKTQTMLRQKQQEYIETIESVRQQLDDANTSLAHTKELNTKLRLHNEALASTLAHMKNTKSWRWTKWMRQAVSFIESFGIIPRAHLRPGTVVKQSQNEDSVAPVLRASTVAYRAIQNATGAHNMPSIALDNAPLISYILYAEGNNEQSLRRTLNTLVQQTYSHWELHIWHQENNNFVPSVVAPYQARYPGQIYCHATDSHTVSLRDVFTNTKGELLFHIHEHWLLEKTTLEALADAYNQNSLRYNAYITPYMTADLTGIPTKLHTLDITTFHWRKRVRVCLFPRAALRELADSNPTLPITKPALLLRALSCTPETVYVHNSVSCTEFS